MADKQDPGERARGVTPDLISTYFTLNYHPASPLLPSLSVSLVFFPFFFLSAPAVELDIHLRGSFSKSAAKELGYE